MAYIAWRFRSLVVPMIMGNDGVLYTTSKAMSSALGISLPSLSQIYKRASHRFSDLRLTQSQSKSTFLDHRHEFGITRAREDMRIWTENDMIRFAACATSEAAEDFMQGVIELVKANAKIGSVTKEEHESLQQEVRDIKNTLSEMQQVLNDAASFAGKELNLHKKTRSLRLVQQLS